MNIRSSKSQKLPILLGTGIAATAIGAVAQPANAFTITSSSGSWDNVTTMNGSVIGSDGIGASDANFVKFLSDGDSDQVRWGDSAYEGKYVDQWVDVTTTERVKKTEGVPKRDRRGRIKRNKRGQIKYKVKPTYENVEVTKRVKESVWVPATYENQSGLGYAGVSNLDLDIGQVFKVGDLTHFNQAIYYSDGFIGTNAEFDLSLDFDGIGKKDFSFAFTIDETVNNTGRNNNGADCAYQTDAGKGCADLITWDTLIDQSNSFSYEGEDYTLELVGFADDFAGNSLRTSFVSQENADNSAGLFARLTKVDRTQDIPEPASLFGLAGLGMYFVRSRKKRAEDSIA